MPGSALRLDLRTAGTGEDAPSVLVVTARRDAGDRVLAEFDVPIAAVDSGPLSRTSLRRAASGLIGSARGVAQALPLVSKFKPDVVVGAGGYASVPVVTAAAMLRSSGALRGAKIVVMNPDVVPGLANRALARMADEVWGAYAATSKYFPRKFVLTGTPVRPEFYAPVPAADARKRLGLDPARSTVLIFGGSQGARTLNVAASSMVSRRKLPDDWQVLHVAGDRDHEWMAAERSAERNDNRYVLLPYLAEMALAFAAADVAVCRAGASTLAELACIGLPAILIPYPFAAENHQRRNAQAFAEAGAAMVMEDDDLDPDALYWKLVEMLKDERLGPMRSAARQLARPRALHDMVERILLGRVGTRVSA